MENSLLRSYCENHLALIHFNNNVLFPRAFCLSYGQKSKMFSEDLSLFFSQNPNKQTAKRKEKKEVRI